MLAGEKGSEGGVGATAAPPPVTRVLLLLPPGCVSAPMRLLLRILQTQQQTSFPTCLEPSAQCNASMQV
jgi:hypothetical protein